MEKIYHDSEKFFENPKKYVANSISIVGRIKKIRKVGKTLNFVIIQLNWGMVQCVVDNNGITIPRVNSIVLVEGIVRCNLKVKNGIAGVELLVKKMNILSEVKKVLPMINIESSVVERINNRHLDLRNEKIAAIFKVKSTILKSAREFLYENKFIEVYSSKIIGDSVQGPIEAFSVNYFGSNAYLSLSNMLYHSQIIGGDLTRIFEIGPMFRANNANTKIHLSEFTVLDYSIAYLNRDEVIELTNNLIAYTLKQLSFECQKQLDLFSFDCSRFEKFEIISYQEIFDYLNTNGMSIEYGSSIPKTSLNILKDKFKGFFWIIDHPEETKAFYSKTRNVNNKSICYDLQLWHPDITDIADGAERITDAEDMTAKLIRRGLDPNKFKFYLNVLDHGIPPSTGIGLGMDRFTQLILGLKDVREAVLFPRGPKTKLN